MLIEQHLEPITPFLHKVKDLFESKGVSSILVVGGSGVSTAPTGNNLCLETVSRGHCAVGLAYLTPAKHDRLLSSTVLAVLQHSTLYSSCLRVQMISMALVHQRTFLT